MGFSFLKSGSKKTILGVDIGSQNTKIIGLKKDKKQTFVSHFSMVPTVSETFALGKVRDANKLSEALIDQVLKLDISNDIEIVLGASGKGVIAKRIDIPEMEDYMIPEYVEIEAEQELFYNKDEMYLDYQILQNIHSNKPDLKSLFVMTILKQSIDNYMAAVPEEVVSCHIVDTNFSALYNIFEYNKEISPDSICMVIDSGFSMTNIIVIIQNQVVFARSIPFGGDFFTQEIQKKMFIDYSNAEDLKLTASQGGDTPSDLVQFVKEELCQKFMEEINSCYELYLTFYPEKYLTGIYVTGGNSQMIGLKDLLGKSFNVEVEDLNLKNIQVSSEFKNQISPIFYSIASGLSLRGLDD